MLGLLLLWSPLRAAAQFIGPLAINPIADTNIAPGTSLSITVSVTNNVQPNSLLWSLSPAPAGAAIVNGSLPNTAVFTWTADQSPSTNNVTVLVQEIGNVTNVTGRSFTIIVQTNEPASTGPVINPIPDQTVSVGQLLQVTVFATNTDNSNTPIIFSLDPAAPDGVTISNVSNNSAIIQWTPTADQAPDMDDIGVIAEEQTNPPLDNKQFFTVNVVLTNNCESFDAFLAAVTQGGIVGLTNCATIVLSNTIAIVNDVEIDGTNNPVITGNNLVPLFAVFAPATLTLNGLTLQGGRGTNGGAILIQPGAQAIISNCVFQGNSAAGTNGAAGVNGADSSSGIG